MGAASSRPLIWRDQGANLLSSALKVDALPHELSGPFIHLDIHHSFNLVEMWTFMKLNKQTKLTKSFVNIPVSLKSSSFNYRHTHPNV